MCCINFNGMESATPPSSISISSGRYTRDRPLFPDRSTEPSRAQGRRSMPVIRLSDRNRSKSEQRPRAEPLLKAGKRSHVGCANKLFGGG